MQTSTRTHETRLTQAGVYARLYGGLVAALALAATVAIVWLFVRTGAGRIDVAESDALLATALVLAIPPAWFVWIAMGDTWDDAGPPAITSTPRRVGRLMASPVALPLWVWLTLTATAAGLPFAAIAMALLGSVVALRVLVALLRWLVRPILRRPIPAPAVGHNSASERHPS